MINEKQLVEITGNRIDLDVLLILDSLHGVSPKLLLQSHITTGLQMILRQISNDYTTDTRLIYNHCTTILR